MIKTGTFFVAFIDILGFGELVKKYDKGLLPSVLNDLKSALDNATSFLKIDLSSPSDPLNWKKSLKVHLFSDCLCAAIPINLNYNDVFHNFTFFHLYISTYQNLLMEKGFFARGGVSIGSFYSDENMIFSGALVESVELEKTAIYPRILISKSLIDKISALEDKEDDIINEMFVKDSENRVFLNNFNIANCTNLIWAKTSQKIKKDPPMAAKVEEKEKFEVKENNIFRAKIKSNIRKALLEFKNDEKVLQKYVWLKHYFDWTDNEAINKLSLHKF
jgi:hypothetical protein